MINCVGKFDDKSSLIIWTKTNEFANKLKETSEILGFGKLSPMDCHGYRGDKR